MKSTDSTNLIETVIASGAASGYVTTIPKDQAAAGDGTISLTLGSPPECTISVEAGGKRPLMKDVNGVYRLLSAAIQSAQSWGVLPFSSSFAAAIGGYPKGAVCSDGVGGLWVSSVDDNASIPGTAGATWASSVNGCLLLSSTTLQTVSGAVTFGAAAGGLKLTNAPTDVPGESTGYNIPNTAWVDEYFSTKTALSEGISAAESHADTVAGKAQSNAKIYTNSVISQFFATQESATLTVPYWATRMEFILTGGGGGGGNCWADGSEASTTNVSAGGGGGASTAWGAISVLPNSQVFAVIGAGGIAQSSGGTSSLSYNGSTVELAAGGAASVFTSAATSPGGSPGPVSGSSATWITGGYGSDGQSGALCFPGNGGSSFWGGGGRAGASGGISASAFGAGGGGAYDGAFHNQEFYGGSGMGGILMYRWLP